MAYWPRDRVQPVTKQPSNQTTFKPNNLQTKQPSNQTTFNLQPSTLKPWP
ncbi:MAG: hypothetical protein F6J98_22895, partial [Moorea sp. SIO4G2]|nr:hypothetical protein [Moorena sp. SIO4G2]